MNHLGLARELAVLYDRPLRGPAAAPRRGRREPAADAARGRRSRTPSGCPRYVGPRRPRRARSAPARTGCSDRLRVDRPAADQQRRRRHQLRPLGARPAAPRLRPRDQLAGGTHRRAPARAAGETPDARSTASSASSTAEHAGDRRRASGRSASPASWAALDTEVDGRDPRRAARERPLRPPGGARATAQALGMHTDASHRFERGVDPEGLRRGGAAAPRRCIAELAGGTVARPAIDARRRGCCLRRREVGCRTSPGSTPSPAPRSLAADVERWLAGLGFACAARGRRRRCGRSPSPPGAASTSLAEPPDLFEEVLRLYGFDRIAPALPAIAGLDAPELPGHQLRRERCAHHLAGAGYAEADPLRLPRPTPRTRRSPACGARAREPGPPLVANPLSERHGLHAALAAAEPGRERRASTSAAALPAVRLFEIGHVFWTRGRRHARPARARGAGRRRPRRQPLAARASSSTSSTLKGAVEALADALGARLEARPADAAGPAARPRRRAAPAARRAVVGDPRPGRRAGGGLSPLRRRARRRRPSAGAAARSTVDLPSRFPGSRRRPHAHPRARRRPGRRSTAPSRRRGRRSWSRSSSRTATGAPGVPEGAVNTTIHFLYNAADRSLTQEEVNARQARPRRPPAGALRLARARRRRACNRHGERGMSRPPPGSATLPGMDSPRRSFDARRPLGSPSSSSASARRSPRSAACARENRRLEREVAKLRKTGGDGPAAWERERDRGARAGRAAGPPPRGSPRPRRRRRPARRRAAAAGEP